MNIACVKVTDTIGDVIYLTKDNEGNIYCFNQSDLPLSLSYVGTDAGALHLALEIAETPEAVLAAVQHYAFPRSKAELFTPFGG